MGRGVKDRLRQWQTDFRGGWEADVRPGKAPSYLNLLCERWEAPERCSLFLQREPRPLGRKTSLTLTVSPVRELSRENFVSHDPDVGYVQIFSTTKTAHSHCQAPMWDPCSEARKKRESWEAGCGVRGVVVGCWKALLSSRADKPCFIYPGQRSPIRQPAKACFEPHRPHPGRHRHTCGLTENQTDVGMLAEIGQRRFLTSRLCLYRTTQKWQNVKTNKQTKQFYNRLFHHLFWGSLDIRWQPCSSLLILISLSVPFCQNINWPLRPPVPKIPPGKGSTFNPPGTLPYQLAKTHIL